MELYLVPHRKLVRFWSTLLSLEHLLKPYLENWSCTKSVVHLWIKLWSFVFHIFIHHWHTQRTHVENYKLFWKYDSNVYAQCKHINMASYRYNVKTIYISTIFFTLFQHCIQKATMYKIIRTALYHCTTTVLQVGYYSNNTICSLYKLSSNTNILLSFW